MSTSLGSSKELVLKLFGSIKGPTLALAAGHGKKFNWRGVLEPTSPVAQCIKSGHPFVDNIPCYLCGLPIPAKKTLGGTTDERYPECEHILPVTEARWYLDLYMSTSPPTGDWAKEAVNLEYEQSHRVCNQAKSNMSFIGTRTDGEPYVNDIGIERVLAAIKTRAKVTANKYSLTNQISQINIDDRLPIIRDRVQRIVDHIYKLTTGREDENKLLFLSLITSMVDPSKMSLSVRTAYNKENEEYTVDAADKLDGISNSLAAEFLEQMYIEYPKLRSPSLTSTLYEGSGALVPVELQDSDLKTRVDEILKKYIQYGAVYFTDDSKTFDRYRKLMLSTVYYGVLIDVLKKIQDTDGTDEIKALFCRLYNRLTVIQKDEPRVRSIIGKLPDISNEDKKYCNILESAARRNLRTTEDSDDIDEDPPTPDEYSTYYLYDLEPFIISELAKNEIPSPIEISNEISTSAKNSFVQAFPEGITAAKQSAADISESIIRGKIQDNLVVTEDIVTAVVKFILNNRNDETPSDEVPPVPNTMALVAPQGKDTRKRKDSSREENAISKRPKPGGRRRLYG